MTATSKRRWYQFNLRTMLVVTLVGPPLIAGCYFLVRQFNAPAVAIVLSAMQILLWSAVLVYLVGGWFTRR